MNLHHFYTNSNKNPEKALKKVVLKEAAFYVFCEICKLVNGDTKSEMEEKKTRMKEFLKKTLAVLCYWMVILVGLPYAMVRIGWMVFKQEQAVNFGELFDRAYEDYFK